MLIQPILMKDSKDKDTPLFELYSLFRDTAEKREFVEKKDMTSERITL